MSRSSAARTVREAHIEKPIPLRGGVPAFPGDDIEFVCRALRLMKNEKGEPVYAGTITEVVIALGLKDRYLGGGPTGHYLRIRAALIEARRQGLVKCEKKVYALSVTP